MLTCSQLNSIPGAIDKTGFVAYLANGSHKEMKIWAGSRLFGSRMGSFVLSLVLWGVLPR